MISKRAKRRVRLVIAAGAVVAGGFAVAPQSATAGGLCATVTVYQPGSSTPVGGCYVDPGWIDNCAGASDTLGGYGAGIDSCVPTPI